MGAKCPHCGYVAERLYTKCPSCTKDYTPEMQENLETSAVRILKRELETWKDAAKKSFADRMEAIRHDDRVNTTIREIKEALRRLSTRYDDGTPGL